MGLPLATTLKHKEFEQIRELLHAVVSENQAEEISDRTIDCILHQAYMEPENRGILTVLPPKNRGEVTLIVTLMHRLLQMAF